MYQSPFGLINRRPLYRLCICNSQLMLLSSAPIFGTWLEAFFAVFLLLIMLNHLQYVHGKCITGNLIPCLLTHPQIVQNGLVVIPCLLTG